ncbi:uncharacterized protein LOC123704777 [Colias croceus]|uniref:uncharacterized protein LOC123704777 n=1 Tax=Colias crocea TaxID=72248 RepID=UPI001E280B00|nr:uncharacterized protein LOC123704777 [Colias croceus]
MTTHLFDMNSRCCILFTLFHFSNALWKRGVIHYTINNKDYDLHSQDEIVATFSKIQEETCLKFFMTTSNSTSDKILFISNPDRLKTCPPSVYDYSKSFVLMPIGYKCVNQRDIARIVYDMIKASIENIVSPVNSYDLVKKFQMKDRDTSTLLSQSERDYINTHYYQECGTHDKTFLARRRNDDDNTAVLSADNMNYYKDKVWPLGILLYGIDDELRGTADHDILTQAMASIELATYVVFQEVKNDKILAPKNLLWFSKNGDDGPAFGVQQGNQTIKLSSMVHGAAGHTAHTINNLMRALGVHMTSNRFDRDSYVTVNWNNVVDGKEQYLERAPEESWLPHIPYDFMSVTHAPANYMCSVCELGASTVQPIQDHQWQRTMSMGHTTVLTDADRQTVNLLYSEQYRKRFGGV